MKLNKHFKLLRTMFALAGIVTALLAPSHVMAQAAGITFSPTEMALLPEYCKYTQYYRDRIDGGRDPAKMKHWYAVFGGGLGEGTFHSMHHYCFGLTQINYAKFWVTSKQDRTFRLEQSIGEFNFVIISSQPGERMLPDLHTKTGESLIALGKAGLAVVQFERAIELKPDYWPPYAAMSDHYKATGNIKAAREYLERGLSAAPETKALTRRLAELDAAYGKPKVTSNSTRKQIAPKQIPLGNDSSSAPQTEKPQPVDEK
jgi:tetratricopeptide (TPR) repeat protein